MICTVITVSFFSDNCQILSISEHNISYCECTYRSEAVQ